jgi:hypothetical protein
LKNGWIGKLKDYFRDQHPVNSNICMYFEAARARFQRVRMSFASPDAGLPYMLLLKNALS